MPLFHRRAVLAHDVADFSKIWQAMGRSRTMNATRFTIFTSRIEEGNSAGGGGSGLCDIKSHPLTRVLYVQNCDSKMAGNLSSIYQTLVSLYNLSQDKFYYCDEIVNVFIEKMEMTIAAKVKRHESALVHEVLGTPVPSGILTHILGDKFAKSARAAVSSQPVTPELVRTLLGHVVHQKFEQRAPSGDVHDELLGFLCGDDGRSMEINYTKQMQKQKQKQQNKDQDADTMETFDKRHQLTVSAETDNYFAYTLSPASDSECHGHGLPTRALLLQLPLQLCSHRCCSSLLMGARSNLAVPRVALNLPLSSPIFHLAYSLGGKRHSIRIYPTLQFLYSHHIQAEYIGKEVRELLSTYDATENFVAKFLKVSAMGFQPAPLAAATAALQLPLLCSLLMGARFESRLS